MPVEDLSAILSKARGILLAARKDRHPPFTDDKILADWNGLMIAAFARAAQVFDESRYREAAMRAAGFILGSMRNADGRISTGTGTARLASPGRQQIMHSWYSPDRTLHSNVRSFVSLGRS